MARIIVMLRYSNLHGNKQTENESKKIRKQNKSKRNKEKTSEMWREFKWNGTGITIVLKMEVKRKEHSIEQGKIRQESV